MWGIVVIVAACCLAFGAVDAATKMREKKQAASNLESDTESTLTQDCEQTLSYTQNANQQAQRSNDD